MATKKVTKPAEEVVIKEGKKTDEEVKDTNKSTYEAILDMINKSIGGN